MRTGTTGAIVKHHGRRSRAAVHPDIGAVGLARARSELGYRGLIGMQHGLLQQMVFEGLGQRFQAHAAQAHPLRHARAREVHAAAAVNLLLAVQRQVIVVLGQHHLRQQAGGGNAFVNELRWQGCSQHRLAARTGVLAADVPVHEEACGLAVELLADLLPDTAQGVALRAQAGVDLVAVFDARQLAGQGLAFGETFAWGGALLIGGAVLGLFLGLQQRLRLGVEELALRVQALAGLAEAPLLEARQLEAQGRNLGLLELQIGLHLGNDRTRVLRRRIVAQGLEFVVVDGADHAEFSRAHARARIGSCPDRQTPGGTTPRQWRWRARSCAATAGRRPASAIARHSGAAPHDRPAARQTGLLAVGACTARSPSHQRRAPSAGWRGGWQTHRHGGVGLSQTGPQPAPAGCPCRRADRWRPRPARWPPCAAWLIPARPAATARTRLRGPRASQSGRGAGPPRR